MSSCIRHSLWVLSLASLCCCSLAAQISGTWVATRTTSDGTKVDTTFFLEQKVDVLSGTVRFDWGDLRIIDGSVRGEDFAFRVADHSFRWHGHITPTRLEMIFNDPSIPETILVARRVDPSTLHPAARLPLPAVRALRPNRLALTPPMGWNSWNCFHGDIDDQAVRETADAMVATGLRDAGYVYINIDDTWEGERNPNGNLQANKKFPDMKALADYVHSRGLKIGIYSSPGPKTCGGYVGSYGHEQQDANTFAAWGIDYLKYDWCSAYRVYQPAEMRAVYQKMGEALQKTGRPMVFSLCQYGIEDVWKWGPLVGGNLWRTSHDISASFDAMLRNASSQANVYQYNGPGHWNDPDMLEVGNGGMSPDEARAHMSLWALLAAPLIAGNDLRHMDVQTLAILTDPDLIAIDQDALGLQARRVTHTNRLDIWVKPLQDGGSAIGIFNTGSVPLDETIRWSDLGLNPARHVRDLWSHQEQSVASATYSVHLAPHAVRLLRASKR